tara:strand:+ start:16261 stop:16668 length:408 start_codon:yes stop_codon:yes gene_type:complete
MTNLTGIPAPKVPGMWPLVSELVTKALDRSNGAKNADDVLMALMRRDMQLWMADDDERGVRAICVTEVINHPQRRACFIYLVAGIERDEWLDHEKGLSAWAREQGCGFMETYARVGWKRVLKDWTPTAVVLHKEL